MVQPCTIVRNPSSTKVRRAHNRLFGLDYRGHVPKTSENAETIVARNLKAMMDATSTKEPWLHKHSGVSVRMIQYVLRGGRIPSIKIVDDLARAYGLQAWQLLLPTFRADLAIEGRLQKAITNYVAASPAGRDYIDHVAEKEATYNSKPPQD